MNMLPRLLSFLLAVAVVPAQTFTTRAGFAANSGTGPVLVDDFNAVANGAQVASLFQGLVRFTSPLPTGFLGGWGAGCGPLVVSGTTLIPSPRYASRSLVLPFTTPVFGVGAEVFDDYDGNPRVATITLTVTTTTGQQVAVSESCDREGDAGFLGVIDARGITSATFSIAAVGANLEIDELVVLGQVPASVQAFGSGCPGRLGQPGLTTGGGAAPRLGSALTFVGNQVPGAAVLFFGASTTSWNGNPLPIDGASFGAPGCLLLTGADVDLPLPSTGPGSAATSLGIPSLASLHGARLYAQMLCQDPAANPAGVVLSNGLSLTIGD